MKALLAEDNDLYREVLQMALEESGFRVTEAPNGFLALKILEENPDEKYDLIVTDFDMPIMNGQELIHAILQKDISYKRLILLSGSTDLKEMTKLYNKLKKNIFVVTKDLRIAQLKEKLFKL